jgi:hypothetical protein
MTDRDLASDMYVVAGRLHTVIGGSGGRCLEKLAVFGLSGRFPRRTCQK